MARPSANQLLVLEEATGFERYVIEEFFRDRTPSSARVDLRVTSHAQVGIHIIESLGAGAVEAAFGRLLPLVFGAGYKILDLLLEIALETGGNSPSAGGRWRMDEKAVLSASHSGEASPLTDDVEVWTTITTAYAEFLEVRHSLVHRTATVGTDGVLIGVDRNGAPLDAVDALTQQAFAQACLLTVEAVLDGLLPARRRQVLAWHLSLLGPRIGTVPLSNAAKSASPVLIDAALEHVGGAVWRFSPSALQDRAGKVFQDATWFDAILHAGEEQGHLRFYCELDAVPNDPASFEVNSPPPWVRRLELGTRHEED